MRPEFVQQMITVTRDLAARPPDAGRGIRPAPAGPADPGTGARWCPASWQRLEGADVFAARDGTARALVIAGAGPAAARFPGEIVLSGKRPVKLAPFGPETCAALRDLFPWSAPGRLTPERPSFGCGDRLGAATPGHLRALRPYAATPVLAQQSVRELTLTGRAFREVVDAATWGVFQEGYQEGWGADGDHLKSAAEVRDMLAAGATFITLDLSLCLGRPEAAPALPAGLRAHAGRRWSARGIELAVADADIERFWQVYGSAFPFIEEAAAHCQSARGSDGCDLEVSVDETPETTRPVDHLLLALELRRRGIPVASVAPRFPGEFQKAIDYVGDLGQFERELARHAAIAREFGHKLGIHSGSDKFTAFPLIGRHGGDCLHVKTAGTSWLEALRVIAAADPALFRICWAQAAEGFPRAKQYYHIRTELPDVAGADAVEDSGLPALLDQDAPRQFLHITYGEILRAPASGGGTLGDRVQASLAAHEEEYAAALIAHFRHHAESLGLPAR
ncbi:MAG: hypothetical protein HY321_02915 [Armatimonadetes bacterium]|nr:hypothetical protein [Armatimonadota bacterium]